MPDPQHIHIMQEIQAFSLKHDGKHDKILRKRQGFSLFLKMRHFLKLKKINIMLEIQYFYESSIRARFQDINMTLEINIMQDADYFLESSIRARSQNTNIMKKHNILSSRVMEPLRQRWLHTFFVHK